MAEIKAVQKKQTSENNLLCERKWALSGTTAVRGKSSKLIRYASTFLSELVSVNELEFLPVIWSVEHF